MFEDRADGDLVFARVWGVDLECPACGRVAIVDTRRNKGRDRVRFPQFKCGRCFRVFNLGVNLWLADTGSELPPDASPSPAQSEDLKVLMGGRIRGKRPKDYGRQVNTVTRNPCTCERLERFEGFGEFYIRLDEKCPTHGRKKR